MDRAKNVDQMRATQMADLILMSQISNSHNLANLEQPSVLSVYKKVNQDCSQFLYKNLNRRKTKGGFNPEKEKIGGDAV
jgi:hypothetical protein